MNGGRASGVYADDGETSFAYVRAAGEALARPAAGRAGDRRGRIHFSRATRRGLRFVSGSMRWMSIR